MCMDHWDFRATLSWVALLFIDDTRQDLSRLCGRLRILALGPFWVGQCGCRCGSWILRAGWRVRLHPDGLH